MSRTGRDSDGVERRVVPSLVLAARSSTTHRRSLVLQTFRTSASDDVKDSSSVSTVSLLVCEYLLEPRGNS